MNTTPIGEIATALISNNELAILIIYETHNEADDFDKLLDGHSIRWELKNESTYTFTLRTLTIGSYQFDSPINKVCDINKAKYLACAYRSNEHLELLPERLLNCISRPSQH